MRYRLPIWRNGWISELSKPVDWFHFQSNVCLSQCNYHSTVNLFWRSTQNKLVQLALYFDKFGLRSISLKGVLRIQFQKIYACENDSRLLRQIQLTFKSCIIDYRFDGMAEFLNCLTPLVLFIFNQMFVNIQMQLPFHCKFHVLKKYILKLNRYITRICFD